MKKCIVILLVLPLLCSGQEKKDFGFNFISLNPLSVYRSAKTGGLVISGDISFRFKENVFLLSGQFGSEIVILSDLNDSFSEVSLSWGKEFELADWLQTDIFIGLSYFYFKTPNFTIRGHDRNATVGVPITSKLKVMVSNNFSIGPQIRLSINSLHTIMSLGLAFQLDF
ncbi:hypothetical protein C8N46_101180 [Kordia periserrulae]|uniref:Outer membrane protein with beta-barrel domain n=1 Tax=Kordia periserrulae TaxID=701523 RepID=A0A2T6C5H5_9FLAO|nr:hypothetical protein [Kordia periserrulae]PTX63579.1 hypothetical protein C8N46_101180 [Kordia periserrulae]